MPLAAAIKIPMGTVMPSFQLPDFKGKSYKSDTLFGSLGFLVIFTSHECPYTLAAWPRLVRIAKHAKCLGINSVAINSSLPTKDTDRILKKAIKKNKELKSDFPYLIDETQKVAKSFQAQCTPEVFLYDQNKKLAFLGRIDDNWKDEAKATSLNLKFAIDALASGQPVERRQIALVGSSIRWRTP